MDAKIYGLKSDKLKKVAVKIFGGIVENVFIADWYKPDNQVTLKQSEKIILGESESDLRYDSIDIIIEFTNGNFVRFQNSEWAFMAKLEKTDFEVI